MERKKISSKVFLQIFSICISVLLIILLLVSKARVSLVNKETPLKSETALKFSLQIEDLRTIVVIITFFIIISTTFKILSFFYNNAFFSIFETIIILISTSILCLTDSHSITYDLDTWHSVTYRHITFYMIYFAIGLLCVIQLCIIINNLVSGIKNILSKKQNKTESQKQIKSEE